MTGREERKSARKCNTGLRTVVHNPVPFNVL